MLHSERKGLGVLTFHFSLTPTFLFFSVYLSIFSFSISRILSFSASYIKGTSASCLQTSQYRAKQLNSCAADKFSTVFTRFLIIRSQLLCDSSSDCFNRVHWHSPIWHPLKIETKFFTASFPIKDSLLRRSKALLGTKQRRITYKPLKICAFKPVLTSLVGATCQSHSGQSVT